MKETKWAEVIQCIIKTDEYNLNKNQEMLIKEFAVFQYCRTVAMENYTKGTMSEILQNCIRNNGYDVKEEIVKKFIDKKFQDKVLLASILKDCNELAHIIDDLDISIIKFNTIKKLIISDMPVIIMNPFCHGKAGFGNVGIVILFPVSPERMIMIYDGKIYNNCNQYMTISNEQEVIKLNKYQLINAEERILSKSLRELELILSDDELILKRKEYQSKKKSTSSFDGRGTFTEINSRGMHYNFELSFCKIPRYLMKIPKECREAFDRQYSSAARKNLLFRVYVLPKLIKENPDCSQINISKIQDGYAKMQKFMDIYWNIPDNERTISPEYMKEIKKLSTVFFPVDKK